MGKCYNSVVIDAPCEEVWQAIRDFHNLDWAQGVVTKVDKEGDFKGDQVGAKRIINDAFHETLLSLDDDEHTFSYTIDDGPEPLSKGSICNYIGTVCLLPITDSDTTFIEWQSTYESPDDAAVGDFCNPIYVALLSALKQRFS